MYITTLYERAGSLLQKIVRKIWGLRRNVVTLHRSNDLYGYHQLCQGMDAAVGYGDGSGGIRSVRLHATVGRGGTGDGAAVCCDTAAVHVPYPPFPVIFGIRHATLCNRVEVPFSYSPHRPRSAKAEKFPYAGVRIKKPRISIQDNEVFSSS